MKKLRNVLLCAAMAALPCALAGAAQAAGLVLYDATGRPVAVLTPLAAAELPAASMAAAPARGGMPDDPMFQLIRQMNAQMGALMAAPDAFLARQLALLDSLSGQAGAGPDRLNEAPGTTMQVVVTSYDSGRGTCSETIRTTQSVDGGAPVVSVRRIGDACAAPGGDVRSVPAAQPAEPQRRSPLPGVKLLQVRDYRAVQPAQNWRG